MDGVTILILLAWCIGFCVLCSYVAKEKGKDPGTWAILGFIFGIIALIALAALPAEEKKKSNAALDEAIDREDSRAVQSLIESGKSLDAKGPSGETMLTSAIRKGNVQIVEQLIDKGASLKATTSTGMCPLAVAVDAGKIELVRMLLSRGAKSKDSDDEYFDSHPLTIAASKNNLQIMDLLLSNGIERGMNRALDLAVENEAWDMAELLIEAGADPKKSSSLVRRAFYYCDSKVAKMLLDAGFSVETIKRYTNTCPLKRAIENAKPELVQLLLDSGMDPNMLIGLNSYPLKFAAQKGQTEIVKILLAKGATVGSDAITAARKAGHQGLAECIEKWTFETTTPRPHPLHYSYKRLAFYALGVITCFTLLAGSAWVYSRTPTYSLHQIGMAFRTHDFAKFEKYVDIESVTSRLIDDVSSSAVAEGKKEAGIENSDPALHAGLLRVMRPQMVDSIREQVVLLVEGEAADVDYAQVLAANRDEVELEYWIETFSEIWNRYYEGISYVKQERNVALVGVRLHYSYSWRDTDITLELRMRDMGGYWQVVELSNVRDLLQEMPRFVSETALDRRCV